MLYTLTALLSLVTLCMGTVFEVQVGMNATGGLATVYNPNQITAKVGDRVEFVFRGKNHTVTQSTFAQPCTQLNNATTNVIGADSGFMPVAAGASDVPVFSMEVTDENTPLWFYCRQANHCNLGMVFAINAPATGKTFAAFQSNAATATDNGSVAAPAAGSTSPSTSTSGSDLGSGSGLGSGSDSGSSSDLSGTEDPLASFGSDPAASTGGLFGSGSDPLGDASPTVFINSIPVSSASAVANAADTAPTTTAKSAGFKLESRNVLGMAILGAMSFALAW